MGYSSYSSAARETRAFDSGYHHKPVEQIFEQQKARLAHKDMMPTNVVARECRDSEAHPSATPIQLYLDVTGSMGHIPHDMIKTGLPTLMGTLTQNGVPDAALMFGAIGDHETDSFPLQVAQFESGDAELDMWLTRTYLEGGGGHNPGESYLFAWYFGAKHVRTDAWDKRKTKGFIFTIGDEPCLKALPASSVKGIMGSSAVAQANYRADELLAAAQEQNYVYHIFVEHGGRRVNDDWRQMLGQNLIVTQDYTTIPRLISEAILRHTRHDNHPSKPQTPASEGTSAPTEQML